MTSADAYGVVGHDPGANRRTDYLYRISLKGLIINSSGQVLVVKESGRDWWDLPGGGMDHAEDFKTAIARELAEEVALQGDFTYTIIAAEDPKYLTTHNFWQVRLIFKVDPSNMAFVAGDEGDEIAWIDPLHFKDAPHRVERLIYAYYMMAVYKK